MIGSGRRPASPWGRVPLTELTVLAALVLAGFGLAWWGTERGIACAAAATALGCLAGLELSIREHAAGYRSHSLMLAAAVAAPAAVASGFVSSGIAVPLAVFAAMFGGAAWRLRRAFLARSPRSFGLGAGRPREVA